MIVKAVVEGGVAGLGGKREMSRLRGCFSTLIGMKVPSMLLGRR